MGVYVVFKRIIDMIVSFVGLVVLSPVFILTALIIKLDSKGPVFVKEKMVGMDKKHFNRLKFRTMRIDMPTQLLRNLERYRTRVGKFLRKTSIDKLPQIINVLEGSMSFVGPHTAHWNQYDLIEARDKYGAHEVEPGIIGWAQIKGNDELSADVMARLDGEYAANMSFEFDLRILVGAVLSEFRPRLAGQEVYVFSDESKVLNKL